MSGVESGLAVRKSGLGVGRRAADGACRGEAEASRLLYGFRESEGGKAQQEEGQDVENEGEGDDVSHEVVGWIWAVGRWRVEAVSVGDDEVAVVARRATMKNGAAVAVCILRHSGGCGSE